MVTLEKWMILTPLQKLPKNGEDLGKLIVAKGFEKLPKLQNIAQSGHTGAYAFYWSVLFTYAPTHIFLQNLSSLNLWLSHFHLCTFAKNGFNKHFVFSVLYALWQCDQIGNF